MTQRDELERGLHRLRADVVLWTGAGACLVEVLAREHAERDRNRHGCRQLRQRSRNGMREDVEVGGLTSDQTTEWHHRVETPRSREHRDGRWQFEGAGDLELLHLRARCERGLDGPLGERAGDLVVPAGPHDRDASARMRILSPSRSLPSSGHLPQSSPRMRHHPVNG
jgi:hypothetical protein